MGLKDDLSSWQPSALLRHAASSTPLVSRMLRHYGDPVLTTSVPPIVEFDTDLLELVSAAMREVMYANQGVGLAANQIGLALRLFVYDVGTGCRTIVNPEILESHGEAIDVEGCLSVQGLGCEIVRADYVKLSVVDISGAPEVIEATGFEARVFQHETDHLNGLLLLDRLDLDARELADRFLAERAGLEGGDE